MDAKKKGEEAEGVWMEEEVVGKEHANRVEGRMELSEWNLREGEAVDIVNKEEWALGTDGWKGNAEMRKQWMGWAEQIVLKNGDKDMWKWNGVTRARG